MSKFSFITPDNHVQPLALNASHHPKKLAFPGFSHQSTPQMATPTVKTAPSVLKVPDSSQTPLESHPVSQTDGDIHKTANIVDTPAKAFSAISSSTSTMNTTTTSESSKIDVSRLSNDERFQLVLDILYCDDFIEAIQYDDIHTGRSISAQYQLDIAYGDFGENICFCPDSKVNRLAEEQYQ